MPLPSIRKKKPHKCPKCRGSGYVRTQFRVKRTIGAPPDNNWVRAAKYKPCDKCGGTGV